MFVCIQLKIYWRNNLAYIRSGEFDTIGSAGTYFIETHHVLFSRKLVMRILFLEILLVSIIGSILPASGVSAESGWNEAGVRTGIQVSSRHDYFRLYEAFALYRLPWEWRGWSGWGLTPQIETSLGVLDSVHDTGFIGSAGTVVSLNNYNSGFSTDVGISLNFLNKRQFGRQDFGSILQFGACIGVNYRFDNGLKIGYRIQHISNGHIVYAEETPNPGLDLHMLAVSYTF
jgi:hypothetical protein